MPHCPECNRRAMREYALFLHLLADRVLRARLSTGARVLDASDFRQWLVELAEKAEEAEKLPEFFSQLEVIITDIELAAKRRPKE